MPNHFLDLNHNNRVDLGDRVDMEIHDYSGHVIQRNLSVREYLRRSEHDCYLSPEHKVNWLLVIAGEDPGPCARFAISREVSDFVSRINPSWRKPRTCV